MCGCVFMVNGSSSHAGQVNPMAVSVFTLRRGLHTDIPVTHTHNLLALCPHTAKSLCPPHLPSLDPFLSLYASIAHDILLFYLLLLFFFCLIAFSLALIFLPLLSSSAIVLPHLLSLCTTSPR